MRKMDALILFSFQGYKQSDLDLLDDDEYCDLWNKASYIIKKRFPDKE